MQRIVGVGQPSRGNPSRGPVLRRYWPLCCAALTLIAAPAAAQPEDWQHSFATYLMASGMDGEVGIGPVSADVSLSFSDIVDHLKLGMMGAYTAERDEWTIGVDAIYMNLEASKDAAAGLRFDAEANQAIVSLDVSYRLGESLQVLGGLRFNDIEADVAVGGLPGGTQVGDETESWVDPYVGGRYTLPFANRWVFTLRADVGGFDVGAESAWQLVSRFNWQVNERVDLIFGYRVIDVDYEDGEGAERFLYDVQSSGPLIGMGWRY